MWVRASRVARSGGLPGLLRTVRPLKAPPLPRPERPRAHTHLVETVARLSGETHQLARQNRKLLIMLEGATLLLESLELAPEVSTRVQRLRQLVNDLSALV